MLINLAAPQNISQAPLVEKTTAGQDFGVSADIPPVDEASRAEGHQNQATEHNEGQQREASDRTDAIANGQVQEKNREDADRVAQQAEDDALLQQLKVRDREVRVHEMAHASVGGAHAGAVQLEYTRGPDGAQYLGQERGCSGEGQGSRGSYEVSL